MVGRQAARSRPRARQHLQKDGVLLLAVLLADDPGDVELRASRSSCQPRPAISAFFVAPKLSM